jgi:uncharacterized membrane protein YeiH
MQTFFLVLETVGVISFAVSGAIAAIDKEIDLFGVLLLSLITAFGGGLLRDVIIGQTPAFFSAHFHIACGAVAALVVFLVAAIFKKRYVAREELIGRINNYFDAVGLGIFAVMGAKACISAGYTSALVAISLGMTTGIGGGMVRDLCLKEIPFVLKKHVYAVAAIAGAAIYYITFFVARIPEYVALLLGVAAVVTIRIFATKFKLSIPKAIIFEKEKSKQL